MRALAPLLLLAMLLAVAPDAFAERVFGATIPDDVSKLDDTRYRSKKDWDKTMRSFRNMYDRTSGVVFQRIATTPKVRNAYHIQNTRPDRHWDGINVYETADGKVFITVLPAAPKK